ncbi:stage II sporulation protein R [Halalkalibacillus halophilus]|uniref:stage II sporulation protein R n=1 Tax=Halalkalibacillus halophilus TaxID=392827 RepID=UPI00040D1A5D|nr:stage II sporulation protein R [Halalkalibacillus halophilus]
MKYIGALIVIIACIQIFFTEAVAEDKEQAEQVQEEQQMIPDEAIRLRILAESNEEQDQEMKYQVRDQVNAQITEWVQEITDIEVAREKISSNLAAIEKIVSKEIGGDHFSVSFGEADFPDKTYGTYFYPEGVYEAVVITLGEGEGDNWWCVLFPPLCFVEFSGGETVLVPEEDPDDAEEEIETSFFLWDFVKNLFA